MALLLVLAAGPAGLAVTHRARPAPGATGPTLGQIAQRAGCRLTEFDRIRSTNPPISGRVDERVTAPDGSYVGQRPPSQLGSIHALMHGRVLVQYRPDLPAPQTRLLDRFARGDGDRVLVFANTTRMRPPIAAAAYLNLMTCPRVDTTTLGALRAFRDRRRSFGQAF